jgi:hypothetical protein
MPPTPQGQQQGRSRVGSFFAFLGNLCLFGFILLVVVCVVLIQMGKAAQRRNRR